MAQFEGQERRMPCIGACLKEYGISPWRRHGKSASKKGWMWNPSSKGTAHRL